MTDPDLQAFYCVSSLADRVPRLKISESTVPQEENVQRRGNQATQMVRDDVGCVGDANLSRQRSREFVQCEHLLRARGDLVQDGSGKLRGDRLSRCRDSIKHLSWKLGVNLRRCDPRVHLRESIDD